jgi:hypothetical protein
MVIPRSRAHRVAASQNGSSNLKLVRCPAISTFRTVRVMTEPSCKDQPRFKISNPNNSTNITRFLIIKDHVTAKVCFLMNHCNFPHLKLYSSYYFSISPVYSQLDNLSRVPSPQKRPCLAITLCVDENERKSAESLFIENIAFSKTQQRRELLAMPSRSPLISDMLVGQMVILRGDVQRFARTVKSLSLRRIAKAAYLTETPLRGIRDANWDASDRTLRSIERAWHSHEAWQPKQSDGWRITGDEDGYILRRIVDPRSSVEFSELVNLWEEHGQGNSFVDEVRDLNVVSVIDISAPDRFDYVVVKHAPAVIALTGIDKTGIMLRQNRSPLYREALTEDYSECIQARQPRAFDIFWQVKKFSDGSFYRRLLLPCGNQLVSVSLIQDWRFPIGW